MTTKPANEQLEEALADVLRWVETNGQAATDFVVEQAPLYVQEYVAWVFWYNAMLAAICLGSVLLLFVVGQVARRMVVRDHADEVPPAAALVASIVFPFVIGLIPIIKGVESAADAVKAKVAPRVVIVEHLRDAL